MKRVAKLIIVDKDNKYLLLTLNSHPTFGNGPDVPGGTIDEGETAMEAMIREVREETGIEIIKDQAKKIYAGTDYSKHGTHYTLFITKLEDRPKIKLSWEHSFYEWVSLGEFLKSENKSLDTFIHMACDALRSLAEKC